MSRPYTSKFPKVPSTPPEAFRGKPVRNKECIGCGACIQVCPAGALESREIIDSSKPRREVILHLDRCIYCGQCQARCTTEKGVTLTNEYDLASTDRNDLITVTERELVLCERCGGPIATRDHLHWISEKLGPISYANLTQIVLEQIHLDLVAQLSFEDRKPVSSSDLVRVLCPECKRTVILSELCP